MRLQALYHTATTNLTPQNACQRKKETIAGFHYDKGKGKRPSEETAKLRADSAVKTPLFFKKRACLHIERREHSASDIILF